MRTSIPSPLAIRYRDISLTSALSECDSKRYAAELLDSLRTNGRLDGMATSEAIDALTALAAEYEQDANLLRRTLAIVRHHLSRKYDWHGDTKGLMPLMSLALAGELAERLKPIPGVCAGDSVVVLAKAASQIMQLGSSCAGAARARKLQFTFLHVAAVRIVDGIPWVTVDGDLEIPVTGCAVLS